MLCLKTITLILMYMNYNASYVIIQNINDGILTRLLTYFPVTFFITLQRFYKTTHHVILNLKMSAKQLP